MVRDEQIIEEKITSEGYNEQFYRPKDASLLINSLTSQHLWLPTQNISMVSRVTELNKTNITYDSIPPKLLTILFGVNCNHVLCDYYAVEFINDKITLKIYDRNLINHPLPILPKGSRVDSYNSGVGVLYDIYKGITSVRKIYYILDNKFYGLEYDVNTLEQLSISEYRFKGDVEKW